MIRLNKHKKLLSILVIVIVLLGGVSAYYWRSHTNKTATSGTKIDYSPAPKADNTPNQDRKSSSNPAPTLNNGGTTAPTPTSNVTVQITGANVQTDNVHIGTLVGSVTSGTCSLAASRVGGTTTIQLATSTVRQDVNSYDCGVFNVPTDRFTPSGTWQLTLTVTSGDSTGTGTYNVTVP